MVVGEALELFIVFGMVVFSILILVVIDNLGICAGATLRKMRRRFNGI